MQALIDEYRFDLVILLENNTPWVADGLRSLGSSVDRKEFQSLLVSLLKRTRSSLSMLRSRTTMPGSCAALSW